MAVYKVIQNVEAEDKLVGPLTLKEFIYAMISATCIFINVKVVTLPNIGVMRWVLLGVFSVPMIVFAILAAPIGGDQSTELWILSHLKFMLRPRKRTWDQDGVIETVTITAPKRNNTNLTKNLNQTEVQSRLKALATMLDSRGWAIESTPAYQAPAVEGVEASDDRLVSAAGSLTTEAPLVDIRPGDDQLDTQTNATAQRFGALVKEVEQQKKDSIAARLKDSADDKPKSTPQARWGIQNINPIKVFEPDEPSSFDVRPPAVTEQPAQDLESRFKAAESSLHSEHQYGDASPLAAERARRSERKLMSQPVETKANLASSDNFSVSTISTIANRPDQIIKSMPY